MKSQLTLCLSGTILLAAFASNVLAQNESKENKTFEVRTNLIVVDEKGRYIDGIKESDVKVFENGVEQKLTYFVPKDKPLNVSLVVDNTGSVRTQLDQVTSIAKIIIANLDGSDDATVIRFVGREHIEVEQLWTSKKPDLNSALDNLYVEAGQSAVIDALYLASQDILKRRQTANNRRYAIVLISDGEDRNSYYTQEDLLELLAHTDVQIFTIALTKELPKKIGVFTDPGRKSVAFVEGLTNKLAAQTGGTSYIIREKSTKDDLLNSLKALMVELRSQFIIGYTASGVGKDNLTRNLTATVVDGPNGEKRKAVIKETIVFARLGKR